MKAGDTVDAIGYLGEDYCEIDINRKILGTATCPDTHKFNQSLSEVASKVQPYYRQYLRAQCTGPGEQADAWIRVNAALLQNPSIKEGQVKGWGEVREPANLSPDPDDGFAL